MNWKGSIKLVKFDIYKDPTSRDVCMQVVLTYREIELAYSNMHPLHRNLLNSYFEDDSPACDWVFAISEIMKVLEDKTEHD